MMIYTLIFLDCQIYFIWFIQNSAYTYANTMIHNQFSAYAYANTAIHNQLMDWYFRPSEINAPGAHLYIFGLGSIECPCVTLWFMIENCVTKYSFINWNELNLFRDFIILRKKCGNWMKQRLARTGVPKIRFHDLSTHAPLWFWTMATGERGWEGGSHPGDPKTRYAHLARFARFARYASDLSDLKREKRWATADLSEICRIT